MRTSILSRLGFTVRHGTAGLPENDSGAGSRHGRTVFTDRGTASRHGTGCFRGLNTVHGTDGFHRIHGNTRPYRELDARTESLASFFGYLPERPKRCTVRTGTYTGTRTDARYGRARMWEPGRMHGTDGPVLQEIITPSVPSP